MKYGSLFSGVGGLDLGLDNAGFVCSFQVEKDPFRRAILNLRWPGVQQFDDVYTFGKDKFNGAIDLLAGGFSCQPHSNNGKRKASKDKRDTWPEFYRIICEFRPQWVLAENVPGILSSENGRYFGKILSDLAQIGYNAEWDVLSAAAFGASHKRERLFLVAYPVKTGRQGVLCGNLPGITKTNSAEFDKAHYSSLDAIFLRLSQLEKSLGEPSVFGINDGAPHRVDRLAACGEAVVPIISEWIGKQIMEANTNDTQTCL